MLHLTNLTSLISAAQIIKQLHYLQASQGLGQLEEIGSRLVSKCMSKVGTRLYRGDRGKYFRLSRHSGETFKSKT